MEKLEKDWALVLVAYDSEQDYNEMAKTIVQLGYENKSSYQQHYVRAVFIDRSKMTIINASVACVGAYINIGQKKYCWNDVKEQFSSPEYDSFAPTPENTGFMIL